MIESFVVGQLTAINGSGSSFTKPQSNMVPSSHSSFTLNLTGDVENLFCVAFMYGGVPKCAYLHDEDRYPAAGTNDTQMDASSSSASREPYS